MTKPECAEYVEKLETALNAANAALSWPMGNYDAVQLAKTLIADARIAKESL